MEQTQATGTEIATLPVADRAMIALASTATEKHLHELVSNSKGILTVTSSDDRMEAHRAGMALKKARTTIKDKGKAAREDAQAFSKAVIAEEHRLIAIVEPEEERVLTLRDAFDAKVKAEKEEAERKEAARVQGIKAQIAGILNLPAHSFGDSVADLEATLAELTALEITEAMFAEFAGDAAEAKATAMIGLSDLLSRARAAEAEAKRIEEERAELQRIQAEQAQRRHEEEERQKAAAAALAAQERELAERKAAAEKELADKLADLERQRAEFEARQALECAHAEALEMNAAWVPPAPACGLTERVIAYADVILDHIEAERALTQGDDEVSETLTATVVPFEDEFSRPDGILVFPEGVDEIVFATAADPDADLKDGIAILCAAVSALRTMGMSNESILVTVGEALEAIDAREAA